jgi:hypothetical protein
MISILIELLHQENNWLERVQQKLSTSRVGADAEELSEELDVSYFSFYSKFNHHLNLYM